MNRQKVLLTLAMAISVLAAPGCYGSSVGYVGVYGPPVYGPGAWGAYPYPGRYPPMGGGVWIGAPICCDEEDQNADQSADGDVHETRPPGSAERPAATSDSAEAKSTSVPHGEEGSAW